VFFSDDAEANTGNHIVVDHVVVHEFVVAAIVVVLKPNLINLAVFFSNDAEPNTWNNIVVEGFCLVGVLKLILSNFAIFFCLCNPTLKLKK
jgi:hypothetical protein